MVSQTSLCITHFQNYGVTTVTSGMRPSMPVSRLPSRHLVAYVSLFVSGFPISVCTFQKFFATSCILHASGSIGHRSLCVHPRATCAMCMAVSPRDFSRWRNCWVEDDGPLGLMEHAMERIKGIVASLWATFYLII